MSNIDLIKNNIRIMIAKGAPETDIDQYVASEGVTAEQLRAAPEPSMDSNKTGFAQFQDMAGKGMLDQKPPGVLDDAASGFQTGLKQGTIGLAEAPAKAGQWLADKATRGIEHLRGTPQAEIDANAKRTNDTMAADPLNPSNLSKNFDNATGWQDYQPFTETGRVAREAGRFVPGAIPGGVKNIAQKLFAALTGGSSSELAGHQVEGSPYEVPVRIAAGLAGGYAGGRSAGSSEPQIKGQTDSSVRMLQQSLPENLDAFKTMGPEAMVLDASPSTVGLAQGVVQQPGTAKNRIIEAMVGRDEGRSNRLVKSAENNLGEYQSPTLKREAIRAKAEQEAGPLYEGSKKNAPDLRGNLDLQSEIAQQLTQPIKGMSLDARTTSIKFMNSVDDAFAADTPSLVIERLHDLRKRLDKIIDVDPAQSSAEKADVGVAIKFRQVVDNVLKEHVPGWKEADAVYEKAMDKINGINYGYDALKAGAEPVSPEQFRAETTAVPSKQVAKDLGFGSKEAKKPALGDVRTGMTADIRDTMGTRSNDYVALKNKVGGDNAYNRGKLIYAYGEQPIKNISNDIETEAAFARNLQKVGGGSETATRQSAERMVNVPDAPTFTGNESATGLILRGTASAYKKLADSILIRSSQSTRDALVNALVQKGDAGVALMEEIKAASPQTRTRLIQALISEQVGAHSARDDSIMYTDAKGNNYDRTGHIVAR